MFGIDSSELLLLALVALVVIGPKDLPRAMRVVGQWVGKARRVASQFRNGFDEMVRQSELEELEKKWAEENERIMREHPVSDLAALDNDSVSPPQMAELAAATDATPTPPVKRKRKKVTKTA